MRRIVVLFTLIITVLPLFSTAQVSIGVGVGPRFGYGYGGFRAAPYPRYRNQRSRGNNAAANYKPELSIALGYGYPNLDASQLGDFFNLYRGTVRQSGPLTGSVDYRYSPYNSIGLLVMHGTVSASYYDPSNPSGTAVLNGSLENWAILLNFMNYLPSGSGKVAPYLRTAIGINTWNPDYTDASGAKTTGVDPAQLAYQVSLGADISLSKNTAFYAEAGYGKYILNAGLRFKL